MDIAFLVVILHLGFVFPILVDINSFKPDSSTDEEVVDWGTLRLMKKGRNHYVISGTFETFRNMGNEAKASITVLRKDNLSGRYSQQIYSFRENFCKYWDKEDMFLPVLRNLSNLPAKGTCPFPKGKFTVHGFEFTEEQFPKLIPPGDYLVRSCVSEGDKLVSGFEINLTIGL